MNTASITVVVHPERCAATGACRTAAPTVFGGGTDGWVLLRDPRPAVDQLDAVLEARDACPVLAIDVFDADGGSVT